jgi:hypothetical protein
MCYATSMFGFSSVQPREYKSAQWTLTAATTRDGLVVGCGSRAGRCFNTQMHLPLTKEAFRKGERSQDWKRKIIGGEPWGLPPLWTHFIIVCLPFSIDKNI